MLSLVVRAWLARPSLLSSTALLPLLPIDGTCTAPGLVARSDKRNFPELDDARVGVVDDDTNDDDDTTNAGDDVVTVFGSSATGSKDDDPRSDKDDDDDKAVSGTVIADLKRSFSILGKQEDEDDDDDDGATATAPGLVAGVVL
jgi:hypothetical protein